MVSSVETRGEDFFGLSGCLACVPYNVSPLRNVSNDRQKDDEEEEEPVEEEDLPGVGNTLIYDRKGLLLLLLMSPFSTSLFLSLSLSYFQTIITTIKNKSGENSQKYLTHFSLQHSKYFSNRRRLMDQLIAAVDPSFLCHF